MGINRFSLRHGAKAPTTENLISHELGFSDNEQILYIHNGSQIIPLASQNIGTFKIFKKQVASSAWVLDSATGRYNLSILASEHKCGVNAVVVSVTGIDSKSGVSYRNSMVYNSSVKVSNGDVIVSIISPVESIITIIGS